ncbi:MAG: hypothetical protein PVH88_25365 [Ignavibacteria bacterium]|jgi:hypothetical protein
MTKRKGQKPVPRVQYKKYLDTAGHFYKAAKDSIELEYWTAAGVLIVHSAIAFTDTLCIKLGGVRSTADDHDDAINLLEKIIPDSEDKTKALNQLKRIIEEKTRVSYLGELYTAKKAGEMWKRLERFRKWAVDVLER